MPNEFFISFKVSPNHIFIMFLGFFTLILAACQSVSHSWRPHWFVNVMTSYYRWKFHFKYKLPSHGIVSTSHMCNLQLWHNFNTVIGHCSWKKKAIIQTITAARYLVTIEWNHILFSVASMVADHTSQSHAGKKISSYSTDTGRNITFTVSLTLWIHEEYSRFRYGNLVFPQTETRQFLMFPTLRTRRKWNTYAHVYGAVLFTGNSCLRRCETWVSVILNTCLHLINYFGRGRFIFFRGDIVQRKKG